MKPGTRPLGRVNSRAGFNNYGLEKERERFKERGQSDKEKENRWLFQK